MSMKPVKLLTQAATPNTSSPRHAFPRSPGGLLANSNPGVTPISRSTSGLSTQSSSSATSSRPGQLKRRSTDASGGLDYYFSNEAGKRNGPASSSSSSLLSLGISPSPSSGMSPLNHPERMRSKSSVNLRDLPAPPPIQPRPEIPHLSSAGPSNRKIQVVSYPSSGDLGLKSEGEEGWSDSSDYGNNEDSAYSKSTGTRVQSAFKEDFGQMSWDGNGRLQRDEALDGHGNDPRASITSGSTYRPDQPEDDYHRTPIPPPTQERVDLRTPRYGPTPKTRSPITHSPITDVHSTPTRLQSEQSTYTPGSGRLAFVAPFDVSRRSIDALEREVAASSPRINVTVNPEPRSAPAWQNEFGLTEDVEGDQDTIKSKNSRNRMTLPSIDTASSGGLVEAMLSPEKGMLSPDRYESGRVTPIRGSYDKGSPGKSPEPPPRSNKRAQYASPARDLAPRTTAPLSISPRTQHNDLPTIINTPHSPDDASSHTQQPYPRRPQRSPDRSPSFTDSATLNDLTEMLGGAIDAIGLVNSRDTPPPTILEPRKPRERPSLTVGTLEPPAEVDTRPITPNSLPMRGMSFGDAKTPMQLRKAPSTASVDLMSEFVNTSPTNTLVTNQVTVNVAVRPWPAAMLYGHVKGMKNAGDRAKGYARAINDLSRAETGLREWCAASTSTSNRPMLRETTKLSTMSTLGARPSQTLTVPPPSQHLRNVSATSEFPMRNDSYSAREITHRVIGNDPNDQPTALPSNLPYPGIQPNIGGGGMKHSQSMQSVASYSSKKGGLFSHLHMRKSGKDKAAPGLGPPTSTISSGGGAVKKDVRGLSISGPSLGNENGNGSTSPHTIVDLTSSGLSAPRVQQSISGPMGPRNPRMGTYTPPPSAEKSQRGSIDLDPTDTRGRASLDTGLSRLGNGGASRNSLDGGVGGVGRMGKSSAPAMGMSKGSPIGGGDIRQMMDVLPHVERGILRGYLGKYGDEMQAIGAYLEDEKAGKVMRI